MLVVSACLAGVECRYDGTALPCAEIVAMVAAGRAIAVCPEVLGGLPIPRPPAEIVADRILTVDGQDVTAQYQAGAEKAWKIAARVGCRRAILKARSPSCGSGCIYDGSFSGRITAGDGMFARRLKQDGIAVCTEENYKEEQKDWVEK